MAYTPPYTPEQRAEKKKALLDYMRENPEAVVKNMPAEHQRTLKREYRSVKRAREDAGIKGDPWLKEELERFAKYLDEKYGKGEPVTSTVARLDGWDNLLSKYKGGIDKVKVAAGRPEYVHGRGYKFGSRKDHRTGEDAYQRPVHRMRKRERGRRG